VVALAAEQGFSLLHLPQNRASRCRPTSVRTEQRKLARRKPTDGEAHVLADREIGEEVGDLEGPADAAARPQVRGRLCEVLSFDDDAPLGRDGHARNGVERLFIAAALPRSGIEDGQSSVRGCANEVEPPSKQPAALGGRHEYGQ
jgi:hypothetical protein